MEWGGPGIHMSKRILIARMAAVPVAALAVISQHSFPENSPLDVGIEIAGFTLLIAAAMGRVWCAAFISGRKNAELVMDGPYSIMRNPLYFFSFLGFVGAGLAFESFTIALALGALFFLTHWPTILREEKRLTEIFGDTFVRYTQRVPRFVPSPAKLSMPSAVTISPRLFSRALLESLLVLSIFVVAEGIERFHLLHPESIVLRIP